MYFERIQLRRLGLGLAGVLACFAVAVAAAATSTPTIKCSLTRSAGWRHLGPHRTVIASGNLWHVSVQSAGSITSATACRLAKTVAGQRSVTAALLAHPDKVLTPRSPLHGADRMACATDRTARGSNVGLRECDVVAEGARLRVSLYVAIDHPNRGVARRAVVRMASDETGPGFYGKAAVSMSCPASAPAGGPGFSVKIKLTPPGK